MRKGDRLVGVPHEAGDPGGVTHSPPALVGQIHPDQDISRHPDAVDQLALAVLDLGHGLHRDLHVEDVRLHVQGGHAGQKVGLDPVLIAGVGVDDKPVTLLDAQLGAERSLILDRGVNIIGGAVIGGVLSVNILDSVFGDCASRCTNLIGNLHVVINSHGDVQPVLVLDGLIGGDLGG